MQKKDIDKLTLSEYFVIKSSKTNTVYMGPDRQAYLFSAESRNDANQFIKEHEGTYFDDKPAYYQSTNLLQELYPQGFSWVVINNNADEKIEIVATDIPNDFFNARANANILLLRQSKKKQYLRNMAEETYITPVKIDKRKAKDVPLIHYAYATIPGRSEKFYLLFSTLQEFNKWNAEVGEKWDPLEANIKTFNQIRLQNPILVNPLSDKFVLSHDTLRKLAYSKKGA